jgi:chloramphenicol-sensitive protein RarD
VLFGLIWLALMLYAYDAIRHERRRRAALTTGSAGERR